MRMASQIAPPYQHQQSSTGAFNATNSHASLPSIFTSSSFSTSASSYATPTTQHPAIPEYNNSNNNNNHNTGGAPVGNNNNPLSADLPQPLRTSTPNAPNSAPQGQPTQQQSHSSLTMQPQLQSTTSHYQQQQQYQPNQHNSHQQHYQQQSIPPSSLSSVIHPPPPLAPSQREGAPAVAVSPLTVAQPSPPIVTDGQTNSINGNNNNYASQPPSATMIGNQGGGGGHGVNNGLVGGPHGVVGNNANTLTNNNNNHGAGVNYTVVKEEGLKPMGSGTFSSLNTSAAANHPHPHPHSLHPHHSHSNGSVPRSTAGNAGSAATEFTQAASDGYHHHRANAPNYGHPQQHSANTMISHQQQQTIMSHHNPNPAVPPHSSMSHQQHSMASNLPAINSHHPYSTGMTHPAGGVGVGVGNYAHNSIMSLNASSGPTVAGQPMMGSNVCTPDSTSLMMGETDPLDVSAGSHSGLGHVPFRPTMSPLLSSGRIEQTQAFTWIRRHLIPCEDASVPKQEVYDAYKNFCEKRKCNPINPGDFGKIVKCTFPSMKPRRLGARGQSKYCYSGIKLQVEDEKNNQGTNGGTTEEEALPLAPGELERAATQVVCEWAQKLMNAPFNSLLELAEFLVGHLYVNSKSAAAFTILAQMQAKGRRASVEPEPTPYRETPNFLQADKNILPPPPSYGWDGNHEGPPMLHLPPQRASTPLFFDGKYVGEQSQQLHQTQQHQQQLPYQQQPHNPNYDPTKNAMSGSTFSSTLNNDSVSSPLKSFHSAFEEVHSPSKSKEGSGSGSGGGDAPPQLNDSQQRKLASPRRSKTKEPKGSKNNAAASAGDKNNGGQIKRDIDSLQMPPPPSNFTPRCASANILQSPSSACRKRPQSEPRKRTRSDETTNAIYSVSTKRPQYNSVQDLTKSTSEGKDAEVTTVGGVGGGGSGNQDIKTQTSANPLGEMNILHLENDALLDFLGEDDDTPNNNNGVGNSNHAATSQHDSNIPLMHQSFDLANIGQSSSAPPTSVNSSTVQRCANISPSTIGNRPAGMVRPTVRVAPRTENQQENTINNNINNTNNTNASCESNNYNNQNQQNLNSSLEGHSFDDSFNFVSQQQNQAAHDGVYSNQGNSNQGAHKRPDGVHHNNYGGQTLYGRSITAPSPIPPHVYNGHRKNGVSPSPSPANFMGGGGGVMGPSPSPLTINDRAMNYNPNGYYDDDSNNTAFSDQSDFSHNYSQYGNYGAGNGSVLQNHNHNQGGNHTFTPIQPGGEVSLMNNQLEMLGIKSGDTFNAGNNSIITSEANKETPHHHHHHHIPHQSTLLKSYLVDQTNPNICKPTATATTSSSSSANIKSEGERNTPNVQLVSPQHLPASEFLRNQAKISSRSVKTENNGVSAEKTNNDFFSWNVNSEMDVKKGGSTQVPTPPSSITASPPDQRLEQELIGLCGGGGVGGGSSSKNPASSNAFGSKESPNERPVLTPDTDTPLTPLGGGDCLGVHQLGDNLLEELQGFS